MVTIELVNIVARIINELNEVVNRNIEVKLDSLVKTYSAKFYFTFRYKCNEYLEISFLDCKLWSANKSKYFEKIGQEPLSYDTLKIEIVEEHNKLIDNLQLLRKIHFGR